MELEADQAAGYVARRMGLAPETVRARALGGGVSNHVVLIEIGEERLVLKQSLPQLRVAAVWYSDRARIFREAEALRALDPVLWDGAVPRVVFEDRDEYAFAMTAAPEDARAWKEDLLAGVADVEAARGAARIHAAMIGVSLGSAEWRGRFEDMRVFEELRLDPYYEYTAAKHPDLATEFALAKKRCLERRCAFVHGDWSPKNVMVSGHGVTAIDFECVHYGDPAFDAAFVTNHLLLKRVYRRDADYACLAAIYWSTLRRELGAKYPEWLEEGALEHLPLLLLARIDGKSPVEYLPGEGARESVRRFARDLLGKRPSSVEEVFRRLAAWA